MRRFLRKKDHRRGPRKPPWGEINMSTSAANGRARFGDPRTMSVSRLGRQPTYSLIVPAHDEEEVILELAARLSAVMDALDGSAEAILVDDGSRDRTYELMQGVVQRDRRFRLVRLSRNFGHQ